MENSEFKPVKLRLKIDLVSYPAWAEGLVNMISLKVNVIAQLDFELTHNDVAVQRIGRNAMGTPQLEII